MADSSSANFDRDYESVFPSSRVRLIDSFVHQQSRDMKLYMLNCRNHELQQVQKIINGATSSKDESNVARRILRGIGSSPPRCASKCGKCRPCRPVHVPVPPGTPVTAEYYPEAWKCKCGNRLYTP
uniref:Epidermal patterning factor-like protein n=1 Tax=Chenopodium quinoa TaxID=63459 RepID=A0A803NE15_CHEQI